MINIWEYEYCGRIRIIDVDGDVFEGEAQECTDAEDQSDLVRQDDSITIATNDGRLIDFYADEIKSIEKLD